MQGQLGAGTREEVVGVIRVDGLTNITDVALGSEHSCALDSDGFAYCWGSNSVGQLGIGRADEPTEPQRIDTGGTRFIGIEAGALHTCAVATNGAVFCWGFNEHGQLGTGLSGSFSPIVVAEP
jgi:alpha-tubulin suppressor-like RCC1 family protein